MLLQTFLKKIILKIKKNSNLFTVNYKPKCMAGQGTDNYFMQVLHKICQSKIED